MKKVLIVDDSKTILKTAKLILTDLYEVYLANSGEMGLDILSKKEIDLVLMDVDMPDMDGIETVKRIRETDKKGHKKCPVPESNQRHEDFQSSALPTELTGHIRNKSDE